ncbi:hypothetical protein L1887_17026 [Cichorium endivia]|nr:hypothetical protein L1887_17026 [Cichorium endivia]
MGTWKLLGHKGDVFLCIVVISLFIVLDTEIVVTKSFEASIKYAFFGSVIFLRNIFNINHKCCFTSLV